MQNQQIRTFIAVPIPETVKTAISRFQADLRLLGGDIRWVNIKNIHITLKFLGDVSVGRISDIISALEASVQSIAVIDLTIGTTGVFPNRKKPKVFWVGVEKGCTELSQLAGQIDLALTDIGFEPESRRFTPHLTIGRLKSMDRIPSVIEKMDTGFTGGSFRVEEILLIKSVLKPTGAVYTLLKTFKLRG